MEADKNPNILLAFPYPAGAVAQPAALKRIAGGILVQDSERDLLQGELMQRGVLLAVCAAVPRDTFLLAHATSMQQQSDLFTGTKLDQPNRLKLMSQEALKVLGALPTSKETKLSR